MKLKVMSFNMRVNSQKDGINAFFNRTEKIRAMLLSEMPDVVGTQEVTDEMSDLLFDTVRDTFTVIGTGREKDRSGEGTRILYNHKKLLLARLETKWLSETPDVPESRFTADQSAYPRVYTLAEFVDKKSRKIFRMINVHLDHKGEAAKLCGAVQLMQTICRENARQKEKTVLTGDFNALPDSETIRTVRAHLCDLTEEVPGTFHKFGKFPPEQRQKIDYIFSDAPSDGKAYAVADEPCDGVYVSDHFPVCAFVKI